MAESLIGKISGMLAGDQAEKAAQTRAKVTGIVDRVAAAKGNRLARPDPNAAPAAKAWALEGAVAAALHLVSNCNPALRPRWTALGDEVVELLNVTGWIKSGEGDEEPFRMIRAARRIDLEKSYAASQDEAVYRALADFFADAVRKYGPFTDCAKWITCRFLEHPETGGRAFLGFKHVAPPTHALIFSADLGRTDPLRAKAALADARVDRLLHKAEIASEGPRLMISAETPRGGRDGLAIALNASVRDKYWVERAERMGIPLGHCQIEATIEETMM